MHQVDGMLDIKGDSSAMIVNLLWKVKNER